MSDIPTPPEAPVPPHMPPEPQGPNLTGPVTVPVNRGFAWITEGWTFFMANPLLWIAMLIVLFVVQMVLAMIPMLGPLASTILGPVITAGFMLGCRAIDEGNELQFEHLWAGFNENVGALAGLGAVYLGGSIVIMIAAMIPLMVFGGLGALMSASDPDTVSVAATSSIGIGVVLALLFAMLLIVPLMMAYYYAPALIVFHEMKLMEAMKTSFKACLKNLLPFLAYGVLVMVLFIVASIPLGLGLLVLVPMIIASMYISYKDIFLSIA